MKVRAKHWLNADGEWHKAGDEFEVESIAGIEEAVEVVAETKPVGKKAEPKAETPEEKPEEKAEKAEPPRRRGRAKQ